MAACTHIYVIGAYSERRLEAFKIGVAKDPEDRLTVLQTGNHCRLRLMCAWRIGAAKQALKLEALTHASFSDDCLIGEWFDPRVIEPAMAWLHRESQGAQIVSGELRDDQSDDGCYRLEDDLSARFLNGDWSKSVSLVDGAFDHFRSI